MSEVLSPTMRVLIVDDHRLFAEALRASLVNDERIDVVGLAHDGQEAIRLVDELEPDVVIMDIEMPRMDGIEATRRIRESGSTARVLVLTGSDSPLEAGRAREAGACGFVTKGSTTADLMQDFFEVASLMVAFGAPGRAAGEGQPADTGAA